MPVRLRESRIPLTDLALVEALREFSDEGGRIARHARYASLAERIRIGGQPIPEERACALGALNSTPYQSSLAQPSDTTQTTSQTAVQTAGDYWNGVQHTLIDSEWARRYTTRAISVIAMFDPDYINDPHTAERRVEAQLPRPVKHPRKKTRHSQTKRKTT